MKKSKKNKNIVKEFVREEEYYNRTEFIQKFSTDVEFLNEFNFIREIIGSSQYKQDLIKNEHLNFICDCADKPVETIIDNSLNTMKRTFDSLTSKTNNLFYFQDFEKFLAEKAQIHKNIINIVKD